MKNLILKILSLPTAALLIAAAGVGSLLFALTMEYGFGYMPCELCLMQRVPFATTACLALIAAMARPYGTHTRVLLGLCAALFLANSGLAFFHSGVERHWWEFHSACTGSTSGGSIEDLREQLLKTPTVRCDVISWSFLGLTMANINVIYSFALALFAGLAARRK